MFQLVRVQLQVLFLEAHGRSMDLRSRLVTARRKSRPLGISGFRMNLFHFRPNSAHTRSTVRLAASTSGVHAVRAELSHGVTARVTRRKATDSRQLTSSQTRMEPTGSAAANTAQVNLSSTALAGSCGRMS